MERKNVLIIMPWLPYPLISGGHQGLFNGIAAIHNDIDVSVAFIVEDEYQYLDALEGFQKELPNVTLYPYYQCKRIADGAKRKKEKRRNWFSGLFHKNKKDDNVSSKIEFWKYCALPPSGEWIRHISQIIESQHFDFVQVEMPWMLSIIFGLPENIKKVYVHHELGFVRRALELRNTPKEDYYSWAFKKFADLNEISQLNMFDDIIAISPDDAKKLREVGITKPIHTSISVINTTPEVDVKISTNKRLTFVGPESHTPNYDGITWFLENCWSKLKYISPEYTLDIVGKWSNESILTYKERYPDINFLGYVDDLTSALEGSIMIVPINIGSGIRMKILEGTSRGIPFISTTVGAEGIPVKDGEHCFITDDPDTFVEDIIKLQNPELQKKFVKAANDMVNKCYSLDALRRNRLAIYQNI